MDINSLDIPEILQYGFIGVGSILSFAAYNILRRSLQKEKPNKDVLTLTLIFLIFSSILVLISFLIQVLKDSDSPVTIEVDATNPDIWNMPKDRERWYNAPFALAVNEFADENVDEILKHEVKMDFLLFEGIDQNDSIDFVTKFKRMRLLVNKIDEKMDLKDEINIRILRNERIPTISFFNPKKFNGKDAIVYYIKLLINDEGKPEVAFQTAHTTLVKYFNRRFSSKWELAEVVNIDSLTDTNIPDEYFYTNY